MDTQTLIEAIKFFEAIKPGVEGTIAVGSALASSAKAGVYVIQKGAKLISYLIRGKKKAGEPDKPETSKSDVAIVIEISRPMRMDVANYLARQHIDADMIVITNSRETNTAFLPADDDEAWTDLVQEFTTAMNAIKRAVGGAKMHLFLSTPLPLAFALGAVWGTVDEATVYHWEKGSYWPVMPISRELRIGK